MNHSFFRINQTNRGQLVMGITEKGKKAKPWEMDLMDPAGAIKSTLQDMIKYIRAQLQPKANQLDFLALTHDPLKYDIIIEEGTWKGNFMGLGWWHGTSRDFLWHAGATGGYTAFVGFSPERQKGVVILSNLSSSHPAARNSDNVPLIVAMGHELMKS